MKSIKLYYSVVFEISILILIFLILIDIQLINWLIFIIQKLSKSYLEISTVLWHIAGVIAQLSLARGFRGSVISRHHRDESRKRIEFCWAVVFITRDGFAMEILRTRYFKRRDRRKSTSNSPHRASSTLFDRNAWMREMRRLFLQREKSSHMWGNTMR